MQTCATVPHHLRCLRKRHDPAWIIKEAGAVGYYGFGCVLFGLRIAVAHVGEQRAQPAPVALRFLTAFTFGVRDELLEEGIT